MRTHTWHYALWRPRQFGAAVMAQMLPWGVASRAMSRQQKFPHSTI
ncbi:hypothetical protein [Corynebacterium cystitidis]|nr:hypothetical protein [Corynebacterium cystitidis]